MPCGRQSWQTPLVFFMHVKYRFLSTNERPPILEFVRISQSINQSINLYRAIVQRCVLQCGYAESKRNFLRRILNVLTDGAVRQFSGREFQSLGAATEKRRAAAVSKLCGGTDRSFCVDDRSKRIVVRKQVRPVHRRRAVPSLTAENE